MLKVFAIAAALLVSACAGSLPGVSTQGSAGMTVVKASFENGVVKDISWIDGKEKADVTMSMDVATGKVDYSARDVKAVDSQKVRAAVEKVVAEQVGSVTPGVVDAIVRAVITSIVPIPPL